MFVGLALAFFARAVSQNWAELKEVNLVIDGYSVIILMLFVGAVPLSGLYWGEILEKLTGKTVSPIEAAAVHTKSWLLKYVPGQVGSVVGKLIWGVENKFSKKVISASFIYENVLLAISSFTLSLPIIFILLPGESAKYFVLIPIVLLAQVVLIASSKTFNPLLVRLSKFFNKPMSGEEYLLSGPTLAKLQLKYYVPRLLNAIGFALIAAQYFSISPASDYIAIGAVYVLSGIIGILALFVPSGLGVREAVITALLGPIIGQPEALTLAIVSRIYTIVADVILIAVYGLLVRVKAK